MRDEEVLSVTPDSMVGYAYAAFGGPPAKRPWA
jgi:hypothetical protein